MVEFAARIPARFKLHGLTLKYLLRQVAKRYVEPEVVRRPKQGFGFPLAFWLRDELGGFLRRVVEESRFADDGIFRRSSLDRLVEEHVSGRRDHNYRLWALLNLEMWHRLYLGGQSRDEVREWVRESLPGTARS
jgi:asparagine synthase (glutamine-hydrolysing)